MVIAATKACCMLHCICLAARLANAMQVGEIMRQKIEQEGWQLIVQGHR